MRFTLDRTAAPGDLTDLLSAPTDCLWLHEGRGMAGAGEALRIEPGTGAERFASAAAEVAAFYAELDPSGGRPVAFGSFTFDEDIPGSIVVVPERCSWSDGTVVAAGEGAAQQVLPPSTDTKVRYAGSSVSEIDWIDTVARTIGRIKDSEMRKVVLARDIHIWSKSPFDVPRLLAALAQRFPECYTFAVDGFIGATPELLVRKSGRTVTSLVLAGTAARGEDESEDRALGESLLSSEKAMDEHAPAVSSVAGPLGQICSDVSTGEPFILKLANLQHVATAVTGTLDESLTSLEIAGLLHPTAAICGDPTATALDVIRSTEGLDRGRYAGPVGWVDANGDGEWGIALRCAEISGTRGRLFAGGGIVAGSEPEDELEETRIKFRAMMSVLDG